MIHQLLFILFGIVLDNTNFIKLPEPKYESIRVMNYCAWSGIALYSLLYEITHVDSGIYITNTIIGSYVYEIIFHTPDIGHFIHHVFTILTMSIGYASGIYSYNWFEYLTLINYVALSSSILSSLRFLHVLTPYKYNIGCFYKIYYVFSKSIAIGFHYLVLIDNWTNNVTLFENITLVIFLLVHLTQVYFIYIILK